MYKTQEVRWFFSRAFNVDETLLSSSGLTFDECEPRIDYYLKHIDVDLGIKIREHKIEFKERHGASEPFRLTPSVGGIRQAWVKWSFTLGEDDKLTRKIQNGSNDWLRVEKAIIGFKFTAKKQETNEILSIPEQIPSGCQIDYSRLKIGKHYWYTLGFEWFGKEHVAVEHQWLEAIFGNTRFTAESSMGFPEFLRSFF